jgi:hypothetical protein
MNALPVTVKNSSGSNRGLNGFTLLSEFPTGHRCAGLEIRGQKFVVRRDCHFGKQRSRNIGPRFVALGTEADMPGNEGFVDKGFVKGFVDRKM